MIYCIQNDHADHTEKHKLKKSEVLQGGLTNSEKEIKVHGNNNYESIIKFKSFKFSFFTSLNVPVTSCIWAIIIIYKDKVV